MSSLRTLLLFYCSLHILIVSNAYAQREKSLIESLALGPLSSIQNDSLSKLIDELPPTNKSIISNVLKANALKQKLDAYNTQSTNYYKKALSISAQAKHTDLRLWATSEYGFYLYTYRKFNMLTPLIIKMKEDLEELDERSIIMPIQIYKLLGYFLMTVGDDNNAKIYLEKAKKHSKTNNTELATIYDNLGLLSVNKKEFATAEKYFLKAKEIALATKDSLRYAKVLGNFAAIKINQHKFAEAYAYLEEDIKISKQLKNYQNTAYALIKLSRLHLKHGHFLQSQKMLKEAKSYLHGKNHLRRLTYEIDSLSVEVAKNLGDDHKELLARRSAENAKNSLSNLDGTDVVHKVKLQLQESKFHDIIDSEKAIFSRKRTFTLLGIVVCYCLIIVIIFAATTQYIPRKAFDVFKNFINPKNIRNRELDIQKNCELEDENCREILGLNHDEKLRKLLNTKLIDPENWLEFKREFIENHQEYCQYLAQNYPGLTESNLRLIFLHKLSLNNIEIARILGITVAAVKKAKQRLRKKYNNNYDFMFGEPEN